VSGFRTSAGYESEIHNKFHVSNLRLLKSGSQAGDTGIFIRYKLQFAVGSIMKKPLFLFAGMKSSKVITGFQNFCCRNDGNGTTWCNESGFFMQF
jgi:hypothetical protein